MIKGWYYRLNTRYNSAHFFNDATVSLCGALDSHKHVVAATGKGKQCKACLVFPASASSQESDGGTDV